MTKKARFLVRLAGTACLLGFLLWKVDLSPLRARLHSFRPLWYLAGLATIMLYVVIQAHILRSLLVSRGQRVALTDVIRMIFISSFFGIFLPGGFGSDAVLCYALFRTTDCKENVLSSIAFARIVTLLGMIAIALAASLAPQCPLPGLRTISLLLLVALVAGYLVFSFLWRKRRRRGLPPPVSGTALQRLMQFGFRTMDVFIEFGRDRRTLLHVLPLVLVIGIMRIGVDTVSSLSLGLVIPPIDFFIFSAAVSLAVSLPLTVAGIGVREGSYVYLFSLVGVSGADALSISLTSFSFTLWVSVAGAVVYVASGIRARMKSMPDQ